jgi:hypothetical protein
MYQENLVESGRAALNPDDAAGGTGVESFETE